MLPLPISELFPLVVLDALLGPALLDGLHAIGRVGTNAYTVCCIQICMPYSLLLFANLMLDFFVGF